jgi:hypothetical protein
MGVCAANVWAMQFAVRSASLWQPITWDTRDVPYLTSGFAAAGRAG